MLQMMLTARATTMITTERDTIDWRATITFAGTERQSVSVGERAVAVQKERKS